MKTQLKKILFVALCLTLLTVLLAVCTSAATYASDEAALAAGRSVRVGEEGGRGYYTSLSSAVSAAKAGNVITVFGDTTVTSTISLSTASKNNLTFTGTGTVTASCRVFQISSSAVTNITFSGGVTFESSEDSILRAVNGANTVTVTIDGANLRATANTPLWMGNSVTSGTVEMLGGSLYGGGYYGLYFANTTGNFTLNMQGGTIDGKSDGVRTDSPTTTLNLTGGEILSRGNALRVTESAANETNHPQINIDGTSVKSSTGYGLLLEAPAVLTMDSGLLEGKSYAVYCKTASTLTVNGGTMHSLTSNIIQFYAGASTLNVNGGKLYNDLNSGLYFGPGAAGTVVNVTGGEIIAQNAVFTWRDALTLNISGGFMQGNTVFYANGANSTLNIRGGEFAAVSSAILSILSPNVTVNIHAGIYAQLATTSTIVINVGVDAANSKVYVRGGSFRSNSTGPIFQNSSETGSFSLVGGFTTTGGSMVLNDKVNPAKNIEYASNSNTYVKNGLYMEIGAQVRMVTGSNGIRFTSRLDKNALAYFQGLGAKNIHFYTVIVPLDLANKVTGSLSLSRLQSAGLQYALIPAEYGAAYTSSTGYTVRAALTNLKEYNVLRTFTAVSYMTYTIGDVEYTQYAAWNEADHARIITNVARTALADTTQSYTAAQSAILNDYAYFQKITIAGTSVDKYQIVIPNDKPFTEYYTALALQEYLYVATGKTIAIKTASTAGSKQIRIGTSLCTTEPSLVKNSYAVALNGSTLEVVANSYYGYYAVQQALKHSVFSSTKRNVVLASGFGVSGKNASAAAAVSADHEGLRIMSQNVYGGTKFNDEDPGYNDAQRMGIAYDVFSAYHPDVLGLQEYHDHVRNVLNPKLTALGYKEVPVQSTSINPNSTYAPNTSKNSAVMNTAKNSTPIYYDPNTVTLLQYGYFWYADINYGSSAYSTIRGDYTGTTLRGLTAGDYSKGFTWAIFSYKETGDVFAVASTHIWWMSRDNDATDPQPDDVCKQIQACYLKEYVAAKADAYSTSHGGTAGTMPVFLMGDMNTNASRTSFSMFGSQTPTTSGSTANNVFLNVNALSQGETIPYDTHHAYAGYNATLGIYTDPKYKFSSYSNSIDYIFTNDAAYELGNYYIARTSAVLDLYGYLVSDHAPIFTDVIFPVSESTDSVIPDIDWDSLHE